MTHSIHSYLIICSLCIEYNCQGYVDPFQVDITSQIYLNIDDLNLDGVNDLTPLKILDIPKDRPVKTST